MMDEVDVHDVIEVNNCNGKKVISITDKNGYGAYRFRLASRYMPPFDKLYLASVLPHDTVRITGYNDIIDETGLVVGEYNQIISEIGNRIPTCKCGSPMVSDGFDIYCPDQYCFLTIIARMNRLADAELFFDDCDIGDTVYRGGPDNPFVIIGENPNYNKPFNFITNPKIWGHTHIEHIFPRYESHINLATFLVEDLFIDFIESNFVHSDFNNDNFAQVAQFYADMDEFINRRNYDNVRQNNFMCEFLWALGIEALTQPMLKSFVQFEMTIDNAANPLYIYLHALLNPTSMLNMGWSPLEAQAIHIEVRNRRDEFHDIFCGYCDKDIVADMFNRYIPVNRFVLV